MNADQWIALLTVVLPMIVGGVMSFLNLKIKIERMNTEIIALKTLGDRDDKALRDVIEELRQTTERELQHIRASVDKLENKINK